MGVFNNKYRIGCLVSYKVDWVKFFNFVIGDFKGFLIGMIIV